MMGARRDGAGAGRAAPDPLGRQLGVESASDARLETFAEQFTNGPQTPERGATCAGGTTTIGMDPSA